jgi:hypothetical protein
MTIFQSTLLVFFVVVAYMMIVDKNVSDYIILVFKITKINIERVYWMIKLHPKNPVTNLMMWKKYNKIAKELEKELNS